MHACVCGDMHVCVCTHLLTHVMILWDMRILWDFQLVAECGSVAVVQCLIQCDFYTQDLIPFALHLMWE